MIVLDTHAWVWWISDPHLLSESALRTIDKAAGEGCVFISSISAWEVALLAVKGRLQLSMDVEKWISECEALPFRPMSQLTTGLR